MQWFFKGRKYRMIFVVLVQECIIGQHLKERDISKTLKIFSFHWKKNNKMVTWLIAYKTYKKENYEYYGIAFMLERYMKKPLKRRHIWAMKYWNIFPQYRKDTYKTFTVPSVQHWK